MNITEINILAFLFDRPETDHHCSLSVLCLYKECIFYSILSKCVYLYIRRIYRVIFCADYEHSTTMRPCKQGQYPCDSGQCISQGQRCDGQIQCIDGSDERLCGKNSSVIV